MEDFDFFLLSNDTMNNENQSLLRLLPEMVRYKNSTRVMYRRSVTLAAACFAVFFLIVGTVGNFLTIAALTAHAKLRKAKTTPFVINLCASHLLFCVFYLPLAASRYVNEQWIHGKDLCSIFPFFFYGVLGVSMLTVMMIAVNRYIFINHFNIYHKVYKDSHIGFMVAFCWAFSFLLLLPTLKGKWGTFGLQQETFACTILRKDGKTPKKLLFVFGYAIPGCIIIFSYFRIFYKYRKFVMIMESLKKLGVISYFSKKWIEKKKNKTDKIVDTASTAKVEPEHIPEPDEIRITVLMLVVLASFLGCFSLLVIMNLVDRRYNYPDLHVIAAILVWMSSSLNPVIYVYISKDYREAYSHILCPKKRKPIVLTDLSVLDEEAEDLELKLNGSGLGGFKHRTAAIH